MTGGVVSTIFVMSTGGGVGWEVVAIGVATTTSKSADLMLTTEIGAAEAPVLALDAELVAEVPYNDTLTGAPPGSVIVQLASCSSNEGHTWCYCGSPQQTWFDSMYRRHHCKQKTALRAPFTLTSVAMNAGSCELEKATVGSWFRRKTK